MSVLSIQEQNPPFSFLGASAFIHIFAFVVIGLVAVKIQSESNLQKPQIIEINFGNSTLKGPKEFSQSKSASKTLPSAQKPKSVYRNKISNSHPSFDDFSDLKLEGQDWLNEAHEKLPNDLDVAQIKDKNEDYESNFKENFDSAEVNSEIEKADQKIQKETQKKGKNLLTSLERDAEALNHQTHAHIDQYKAQSRALAAQELGQLQKASRDKELAEKLKSSKSKGRGQGQSHGSSIGSGSGSGSTSVVGGVGTGTPNSKGASSGILSDGHGVPQGSGVIRSLSQIRQKPGNKKPMYSIEDRRSQRQGKIKFFAYINSRGTPEKFIKVQSTGYDTLDEKTLAALKTWKFYEGQEGWVELPFEWNLKGGVVQAPSLLRR